MKNRVLILFLFQLLFCGSLLAQNKTITGTVTDELGNNLPGVTVIIKGTTNGTVTDVDGKYRIAIKNSEVILVFTYVGMQTKEVPVGNNTVMDVQLMPDATALEELVVVGYGTTSKRTLTDNVAKVSSDDIKGVPVPSFQNALSGKAAGVRVTMTNGKVEGGINISVRGTSSIGAGNQPLFVLDGVPLINDDESNNGAPVNPLLSIPASEIESIDILKDASSAAIYGARGANGVIIITTKRGKEGKASFNLNISSGISRPSNKREWLNAAEYIELFTEAAENASWTGGASYAENRFDRYSNGTWNTPNAYDTDWQEIAFQPGHVNNYDFSVSGGTSNTQYFFSAAYNDTKGIVRGNSLERFSGRANVSQKISDKFRAGVNFNFSRVSIDRVANDNAFTTPLQAIAQSPISPAFFEEGDTETGPFTRTVYANFLLQEKFGSYETVVYRSIGKLFGEYSFTDFLSFNSSVSYDVLYQTEDSWNGSQVPFQSTNGEAYASNVLSTNYVWSNYATFDKTFNEHSVNVVAGMEYNQSNRRFTSVTATEFPSDDLQTVNSGAEITAGSGSLTAYSFVGMFARATYAYKDKYILKASIRRDGSSRFGSESRFGVFPAVSAGWILSEESFLADNSTISLLKLRASYGELGNAELGNFPARGLFQGVSYNQRPGLAPTQPGNAQLSWESSKQSDIGIEFGLFNDKISGEIDFYKKVTDGLLFEQPLVPSGGAASINRNIGRMDNTGIEIILRGDIIKKQNLNVNASINLARNNNEIITLPDGNDQITGRNILREGETINSFYMIEYAGVDPANGDALYYLNTDNGDGTVDRGTTNNPNAASRIIAGSPVPDWIGGLSGSANYKGLSLSFTFQGEWGASIYNGGGRFQSANADWFDNQTKDQLNRWQNPGDITMVPQARLGEGNGTGHSTRYLQESDFIRLRNVTLAYNLPKSVLDKVKLSSIRVYATAINALTFTKYDGYDPEARYDRTDGVGTGQTFYSAPTARTFTLGVNIGF